MGYSSNKLSNVSDYKNLASKVAIIFSFFILNANLSSFELVFPIVILILIILQTTRKFNKWTQNKIALENDFQK